MSRNQTYIALALVGAVVLAWAAAPLLGSRHASPEALSRAALGFDASEALARTSEFVTANPRRVTGSLEARQSSGYIRQHLQALDYKITYSHFDALIGRRKEVGRNVMGFKAGPDPHVLAVVAHYDTTTSTVQGAMDNGSGVGVMLELARVFATSRSTHSLLFVASDGKEYGLLGAEELARNYPERERLSAVLCLDYVAIGDLGALELCTSGRTGGYTQPWLRDISRRVIRAEGLSLLEPSGFEEHLQRALRLPTTEQAPFLDEGIPAINLGSVSGDFRRQWAVYHSDADVPGNLKLESMARYGRAAERILRTIDETSPIPNEPMLSFRTRDSVYLSGGATQFLHLLTFAPLAAVLAFYVRDRGRHLGPGILRRELVVFVATLLPFAVGYYAILLCRGLRLLPRYGWYVAKDPVLQHPHWGVLAGLFVVAVGTATGVFFAVRYFNRMLAPSEFHVSKLVLLGLLLAVCLLASWYNAYWAVTFLSIPATLWALTGPADGPGGRAANRIWIIGAGVVYYMTTLHYAARTGLGWKLAWYEITALGSGVFHPAAYLLGAAACAIGIRFLVIQSYPRSG